MTTVHSRWKSCTFKLPQLSLEAAAEFGTNLEEGATVIDHKGGQLPGLAHADMNANMPYIHDTLSKRIVHGATGVRDLSLLNQLLAGYQRRSFTLGAACGGGMMLLLLLLGM